MGGRCGICRSNGGQVRGDIDTTRPCTHNDASVPCGSPSDTTELVNNQSLNTTAPPNCPKIKRDSFKQRRESQSRSSRILGASSRLTDSSRVYTKSTAIAVDADDPVYAVSQEVQYVLATTNLTLAGPLKLSHFLQAEKTFDYTDDTHMILGKVCDFVCGANSASNAPEAITFMERGLAGES